VDQICKAVFVNSSVELLDDGSSNKVAGLKSGDVISIVLPGGCDLRNCGF
jgi:hypothetical protein